MRHASNEKYQPTHDGSQTTKSSSNQNARRKGNLQILGVEMKEKKLKRVSQ